ncbi:SPOR domain-containing protein [Pedobacter sp. GSP4]|uniref:HU domain-containing protein n=1 Tax=Pedobacter sp. GSP4 TaxID=3453716 RepID=UPI003EEFAABA
MDILSYLLELLQQRKEVGITGLGTFYKKKYPGRYDKEKQTFLPPGYTLQFTTDVAEEESLVTLISAKRSISAESAKYYVTQFAEDVKQKLEINSEAELENVGRLFFTEHEGLSFEPVNNINYGSEFYGLPTLAETATEEVKPTETAEEEEVYDEIAEAPVATSPFENKSYRHPVIENIELDEVKDDLKNTLKHSEKPAEEINEAPEFIKAQHDEQPGRFGHTPETEDTAQTADHQEIDVPESVKQQHDEHPNRFGHAPETETAKTYLHLEDDSKAEEPIIEAPAFIKEQHAEHPNRFGHDPIAHEQEPAQGMSTWLMVAIAVVALVVIAAITYLIKPELFTGQQEPVKPVPAVIDSPKVAVDTLKAKQDSIAKTDSILKANQVEKKTDTVKKTVAKPAAKAAIETPKENKVVPNTRPSTFYVIAASFQSEKKALEFIKQMEKIGLKAEIANVPGRLKKVSLASFKTEKEAKEQRDILQKKLKGKGYFVQQESNNTQP